ncbi:MAG TPA: DUF1206 domain-containing protein [Sphingomicrobium sp.]|jgi:hypothetical protein
MPDDLARESKFQWWARFGFVVRGILYIVIAWLALVSGRTEDVTGALEYLQRGFGATLMVVLVVGMAGYGLWRLSDAAFGMDSGRHNAKSTRKRIAAGFSGGIYLFLGYKAARIMTQGRSDSGDAHKHAADALEMPAGTLVLIVAAAVLIGAGLVQLYKVWSCSFLDNLDTRARESWVRWMGRAGYAARGIVFLTVGWLLARSALNHDAAGAGGLEEALDALRGPVEYGVAGGLLLFGLFSIVEARYRSIHKPPTDHIKNKVEEAVAS